LRPEAGNQARATISWSKRCAGGTRLRPAERGVTPRQAARATFNLRWPNGPVWIQWEENAELFHVDAGGADGAVRVRGRRFPAVPSPAWSHHLAGRPQDRGGGGDRDRLLPRPRPGHPDHRRPAGVRSRRAGRRPEHAAAAARRDPGAARRRPRPPHRRGFDHGLRRSGRVPVRLRGPAGGARRPGGVSPGAQAGEGLSRFCRFAGLLSGLGGGRNHAGSVRRHFHAGPARRCSSPARRKNTGWISR